MASNTIHNPPAHAQTCAVHQGRRCDCGADVRDMANVAFGASGHPMTANTPPSPAMESREPSDQLEQAPSNSLPNWSECAQRVENSDYLAKRVAEGGYGPEHDSLLANELHRFIYEYDDADSYRSAWFMHRLEKLIDFLAATRQSAPSAAPASAQASEPSDEQVERACRVHNVGWSLWHEPQKQTARKVMKQALSAALATQPPQATAAEPAKRGTEPSGKTKAGLLDLARLYCAVTETPSGDLRWTFAQGDMENFAQEVIAQHLAESAPSEKLAGAEAFAEVFAELAKATTKFPTWPTDPLHALAVLGEEFGELTKDMLQMVYEPHKTNAKNVRKEATQTAAMALRLFASLNRYEYKAGSQHNQPSLASHAETVPHVTDDMRALASYYLNAKQPTREEVEAEHVTDEEMAPMKERLLQRMAELRAETVPHVPAGQDQEAMKDEYRKGFIDGQIDMRASMQAEAPQATKDAEPTWIVNDLGELGVKVGERFFFLYKGDNIEYGVDGIGEAKDGIALHGDDGSQMMYRIVGKREFGEVQYPAKWLERGFSGDRYNEPLVSTPGLSYGEPSDGDWKPLPAIGTARKSQGEAP